MLFADPFAELDRGERNSEVHDQDPGAVPGTSTIIPSERDLRGCNRIDWRIGKNREKLGGGLTIVSANDNAPQDLRIAA